VAGDQAQAHEDGAVQKVNIWDFSEKLDRELLEYAVNLFQGILFMLFVIVGMLAGGLIKK